MDSQMIWQIWLFLLFGTKISNIYKFKLFYCPKTINRKLPISCLNRSGKYGFQQLLIFIWLVIGKTHVVLKNFIIKRVCRKFLAVTDLVALRTLYIVWSLVRRRITRRLTRLQTMCNVLEYCKNPVRCGCGYFFNLLKDTRSVTAADFLQTVFIIKIVQ